MLSHFYSAENRMLKELETEDSLLSPVFLGGPAFGPNLRVGCRHELSPSIFYRNREVPAPTAEVLFI